MRALALLPYRLAVARLAQDARAVTAVEFAMVLPIFVTLFLGGTQLSQAISIKRKMLLVNNTVGELASQYKCISNTDKNNIFAAAAAVVAPYSSTPIMLVLSQVKVDAAGIAKIDWSDGYQATARTPNTTITLPAGLNTPNSWLLFAEGKYTYTPPVGYIIVGSLPMNDTMYLAPRNSASITRQVAACS